MKSPKVLIQHTWDVYTKHLHIIVKIFTIPLLLTVILNLFLAYYSYSPTIHDQLTYFILWTMPFFFICLLVAHACSIFGFVDLLPRLSDKKVTSSTVYSRGLELFWPVVGVSFLISFAALAVMPLLIIPAFIMHVYLMFTLFAFLHEKKHGIEAMATSVYYVKGCWWKMILRLFVFMIVLGLLTWIVDVVAKFAIEIPFNIMYDKEGFLLIQTAQQFIGSNMLLLVQALVQVFFVSPFLFIFVYVLYQEVKTLKDEPKKKDVAPIQAWMRWFVGVGAFFLVCLIGYGISRMLLG